VRHQPRKTHWRVALHPPSTTLPSGAWSPLARVRPDARRRPRRRVATGLERTRLRRPRQSRSGANGRRPPGPTPATGTAPAQRGAAPARTFTDASPTRTSQPHLAAAAPTRRGAAEHLPAPRGPTTRTAAPRTGRVRPARPGPARGAASAGPGRIGPASLRTILYLQRDSNTSLHTHHASPAASSTARPLAQRRSGTPPVVQPGHGSSPHAGPRASYQVAVSQTAAPSGSPLRLRRKGDPEPSGCPAGPRASVSYRDPRKVSRCGLLVPSFRWAAPGSGAERSGTPPVARPSRWVEPHVSLQLPVSPCCGPLVPQLRAGRSWLWRGAIRNPTGCPVESASRAARQPSVPAPSRSVSAAPSQAASAPKRQLIAPPQPRPAQVLSGRRTLIRALGASGGTRQRRPSAVVSAR
jgi:hypothetical protein